MHLSDVFANNHNTQPIIGQQDGLAKEVSSIDHARSLEAQQWLPFASSSLQISDDIRDYVVVPVIVCPTDLPNRNCVAFPYEELLKFHPGQGRPNYKTWIGKPTHIDHKNDVVSDAKGIIFDSYMRKMNNVHGNIYKLIALCGFDRSKDNRLAQQILSGKRNSYSMGARVGVYQCSVCGMTSRTGMINTECGHVIRGQNRFVQLRNGKEIPAYYLAKEIIEGFELSSVITPAWNSATNSQFYDISVHS